MKAQRTAPLADDRSRAGLPEHARPETVTDGHALFRQPIKRNEDPRLLTGQALFVDDVELPRHAACGVSAQPITPTRACARIDVAAARRRAGVVAVYTADDLGAYWQPGPLLVPPPPIEGIVFNHAHPGAAGQGQGAPCRRADRGGGRREPLPGRGRARRHRRRLRAAAGGGRSRGGAAPRRAAGPRRPRPNVAAHVHPAQGRLRGGARARRSRDPRAASATTAAPPRRWRTAASSRSGTRGRAAHGLGHDPGARSRSATASPRMLGLSRAPGARDRAVHRRRLRPEDHDVLPGRGAGPLGRHAARPAGQVDRGPRARTSSPPPRSAARSTTPRSR